MEQLFPVGTRERTLFVRNRRLIRDPYVAGADTLSEKIGAGGVDRELKVPIATTIIGSGFKGGHDLVDGLKRHLAADLAPQREQEPRRPNRPEQPIPADGEAKEFRILVP